MYQKIWVITFLLVFVWSAIAPQDRFTWLLEVAPAVIGFAVVIATHKSFPLTPIVYLLILIHCVILMIGGHYTYAEVPLFNELKEIFDLERNNYDKVGHFAQGFVPAMIARELVIKWRLIPNPGWRAFFRIWITSNAVQPPIPSNSISIGRTPTLRPPLSGGPSMTTA